MSYRNIYTLAREYPSKTAVVHNGTAISYPAFASAIGATIDYLDTYDLPEGRCVVVIVNNLRDCWVTVLALQALGLNTLCINTIELIESLEIKEVAAVVTTEQEFHKHQLEPDTNTGNRVISIPNPGYNSEDLSHCGGVEEDAKIGGHILYTSGTTGKYKKVVLSGELQQKRNAERAKSYRNSQADTVYHCLNFGLWTAIGYKTPPYIWQMGGCIILEQRTQWHQYFLRSGMTNAFLIPEQIHQLLDFLESEPPAYPVEDICFLVAGGFISHKQAVHVRNRVSGYLENIYGSTEINVPILRSMVTNQDDLHWLLCTDFRVVEIVDESGNICPVDQEGELRVLLTELDCNSYLDNPEATETVFKSGFFYPGDMAVRRADNRIRILGRSADVINFRGQKLSVAPIEENIQNLLSVKAVCLFSGINSAGEEEVVVVMEAVHWPEKSDLDFLGREFAQFDQVRFARVYPFPRTQTGTSKIDRVMLRRQIFSAG